MRRQPVLLFELLHPGIYTPFMKKLQHPRYLFVGGSCLQFLYPASLGIGRHFEGLDEEESLFPGQDISAHLFPNLAASP